MEVRRSFDDPVADTMRKHEDSIQCTLTANLTQQILENGADLMHSIELDRKRKVAVRQHHEAALKVKADDLAEAFGFFFDVKADFHDLRYRWPLDNLPSICPCGEGFTVDYAQICHFGTEPFWRATWYSWGYQITDPGTI